MPYRTAAFFAALTASGVICSAAQAQAPDLDARLDRLEAEVVAAENVSAIKRLQREYGYYVDKGMWQDVAELYADDAVANYPGGTYIGAESIRKHPPQPELEALMREAGFERVSHRNLSAGIVAIHSGYRV